MNITKQQLDRIIREEVSVEMPKTAEQIKKANIVNALISHYSLALANLKGLKEPNEQTNKEATLRVETMIKKGYSTQRIWDVIVQMIAHSFVRFRPNI